MRKYLGPGLDFKKAVVFTEAIDPLNRKNKAISKIKAEKVIERFGLDPQRPLITQVSRFDPWKDPWGVIDAYRVAKKEFPNIQLALIGSFASDDPEAYNIVGDLKKYADFATRGCTAQSGHLMSINANGDTHTCVHQIPDQVSAFTF